MSQTTEGIVEMRLFVYGSLIFFIPGFFQLKNLFKKQSHYFAIMLLCIVAALISGRSALIISLLIGVTSYILHNSSKKIIQNIFITLVSLFLCALILNAFSIDLFNIMNDLYLKVFGGTDTARPEQVKALYDGITQNIMGAGHGVGVDYIRSYEFPWRYEVLPLAIIYRVGIWGFLVYSIPAFYCVYIYRRIRYKTSYDRYMIIGLFSMLLATFTNPYLESFEFNVFYVLPFIYFVKRCKFIL